MVTRLEIVTVVDVGIASQHDPDSPGMKEFGKLMVFRHKINCVFAIAWESYLSMMFAYGQNCVLR